MKGLSRHLCCTLALVGLSADTVAASPRDCLDYSTTPRLIDSFALPSPPRMITSLGPHVYVLCEGTPYRLHVISTADPSHPRTVGGVDVEITDVASMVATKERIYVASPSDGLILIDTTAPNSPSVLGQHPYPSHDVALSGDLAYIARGADGIEVLDVSKPDDLTRVASVSADGAWRISTSKSQLVTTSVPYRDLVVYGIDSEGVPHLLGRVPGEVGYDSGFGFSSVLVGDETVFALRSAYKCREYDYASCVSWSNESHVVVFDIRSPEAPNELGRVSLGPSSLSAPMLLRRDELQVLGEQLGWFALDISDPSNPVVDHRLLIPSRFGALSTGPRRATLWTISAANDSSVLSIHDVTESRNPHGVRRPDSSLRYRRHAGIALLNNTAYALGASISFWNRQLQVSEWIETVSGSTQIFALETAGVAYGYIGSDLEASGGALYASGARGPTAPGIAQPLYRIDGDALRATPGAPISRVLIPNALASDTEPVGDYLYAANSASGMSIYDTSGDETTLVTTRGDLASSRIDVDGTLGAAIVGHEFQTLNVTHPTAPSIMGTVLLGEDPLTWVAIEGARGVAGTALGRVDILDLRDPERPMTSASVQLPSHGSESHWATRAVRLYSSSGTISNGMVYVAHGFGVFSIDVRVPTRPVVRGPLSTDYAHSARVADGQLWVASAGGLSRFPLDCGQRATLPERDRIPLGTPAIAEMFAMRTSPNPFRETARIGWALPYESHVSITVYDSRGRRVSNLLSGKRPVGTGSASWSARGHDGRKLPPGVYFIRMTTERESIRRKVVHVR